MNLVCWNIRWGEGRDGRVDLTRIVDTARGLGDPDVICLQEVARHFPSLDGKGADQVAELARLVPGWELLYGAAVDFAGDAPGRRRQFGNAILSRLPVVESHRHTLPRPPPATPGQTRQALEAILDTGAGLLRIVTTHLEYHAAHHRAAQVERLRELHREAFAHPPASAGGTDEPERAPAGGCPTLLCGDLNMNADEPAFERLLEPFEDATPALVDAWTVAHPGEPRAPTCGIHERVYWAGPNCRDFVVVTADLAARVRAMEVEGATDASDHQPVRLELDL